MLVIIPRHRAAEYGSVEKQFYEIRGCRVILDRRLAEGRHRGHDRQTDERRRGERRAGRLQDPDGLAVVFVCYGAREPAGSGPVVLLV